MGLLTVSFFVLSIITEFTDFFLSRHKITIPKLKRVHVTLKATNL